jgi:YHS domain-containing protein
MPCSKTFAVVIALWFALGAEALAQGTDQPIREAIKNCSFSATINGTNYCFRDEKDKETFTAKPASIECDPVMETCSGDDPRSDPSTVGTNTPTKPAELHMPG